MPGSTSENQATGVEFDLGGFTPYRIALVGQLLSEQLARQYRERFGISIPDWRVLVHVAHCGGASVRDIENDVVMEKSKVSRSATRLVARGLLVKEVGKEDKRLIHLTLSPAGLDLMAELLPMAEAFQREIREVLADQFTAFDRAMQVLIDNYHS